MASHTITPRRSKQYTHQPQPANNFLDILFVVLEFLDRRADQLSLIQTQRDIYDLKAPTLLKGVVRISDVFRLDSFNSFMLGAPSARFPRLTHLAITIPSWSIRDKPGAFFTFIQVLSYARSLEELSLDDCEQWFGISSRLPNVLSSLQSLRTFRLVDAGEKVCEMLSLSRSPLNRLDIAFLARQNVGPMMKNLSSTLQELRITETELHLSQSPYPNLTSLVLNNWWTIEVRPLIQLFPNLRRLSYESSTSNTSRRMGAAEAWMYWANVTAQSQRVTWGPPDYLQGDPTTLFTLAPRWRVHHLDITSLTRAGLAEFGAVLFETKPRCLSVEIASGEFPQVARALRGYWAQPEAAQLTTLRVSIMVDILERDRIRDYLLKLISSLPITRLSVSFLWKRRIPTLRKDGTKESLRVWDLSLMAPLILENVPTLKYFSISASGQDPLFWSVVLNQGVPELHDLDSFSGRKVMSEM